MDVTNRHIVVLGAARSGIAAAKLLKQNGASVFVSDNSAIKTSAQDHLRQGGIPFESNGHTSQAEQGDFLVISPGVPTSIPIVQRYLQRGDAVFSEIEAASWFNKGPIVAVTGSNGKTTVANWLNHMWNCAGTPHFLAGNVGDAFAGRVHESTPQTHGLLEISSFQLDHIDGFRPHVSMILNITPDHLDRYQNNFENYAKAKFRITQNQTADDWFIYNHEDETVRQFAEHLAQQPGSPRQLAFSSEQSVTEGAFVQDDTIFITLNNQQEALMPVNNLRLNGTHNLNNGLATALAARVSEIKNEAIRESLESFEGVEHRLEAVRAFNGVRYINDSKATNINATWYALESCTTPVALILGGRDKGNDYRELVPQIRQKVHTIIAIGEARSLIEEQLKTVVPNFKTADTMEAAVHAARSCTKRGEIVLLSPACASFDWYNNYAERGDEFKRIVNGF